MRAWPPARCVWLCVMHACLLMALCVSVVFVVVVVVVAGEPLCVLLLLIVLLSFFFLAMLVCVLSLLLIVITTITIIIPTPSPMQTLAQVKRRCRAHGDCADSEQCFAVTEESAARLDVLL